MVSVVQFRFLFHQDQLPVQKELKKEQGYGLFWEEGRAEAALLLMYLLITVYMCIEIVIIYISIDVSSLKLFLIDVF